MAADRDGGFTLLEVIVALVVVGLALGLVLARGPARSPAVELRAGAQDVAQALRLARARAIFQDRPVALTLDLRAHSYRVDGGPPHTLPAALTLSATSAAGAAARGLAGFRFAPDGSSTGGRIELAMNGQRALVALDWLTGRVSVSHAP